ncbi:MAG: RHS repeat-associated core domain-containing protein [Anaerolineae bacterium]
MVGNGREQQVQNLVLLIAGLVPIPVTSECSPSAGDAPQLNTCPNQTAAGGTQLYDPYGATRYGGAGVAYQYTGQRNESSLDIYYYGARWYDPSIGRFMQADTIVPNPSNPQSLNRYSYVLNNPLKYTDPTGMIEENEQEEADKIRKYLLDTYGIDIELDYYFYLTYGGRFWEKGNWELDSLKAFKKGIEGLASSRGGEARFRETYGNIYVSKRHTLTFEEKRDRYPNHSEASLVEGLGYIDFCATCDVTIRLAKHETDHIWIFRDRELQKSFNSVFYPGSDGNSPSKVSPHAWNSTEDLDDTLTGYSNLSSDPLTIIGTQFLLGGLNFSERYRWAEDVFTK